VFPAPFRPLVLPLLAASLGCGLAACGGVGPASTPPDAIYATTVSGSILTFPITDSWLQAASLGTPTSVAGPANSQGLAIVPLSAVQYALYVSDPVSNAIRVYSINQSSNQPSPAGIGPFPLGSGEGSPQAMVSGYPLASAWLYVATSKDTIAGFSIGTDGALTPVSGSPFAAGAGLFQLIVTQTLAKPPAEPAVCLYASDHADSNGGVSAFAVQGNGALAPVAGSPFATVAGGGPTAFVSTTLATASGATQVLYVGLGNASAIAGFAIAPDCSLSPLAGSPFPAGNGVASLFSGDLTLFAANSTDGTVSSFTIDQAAGALTPLATTPLTGVGGSGSALNANGLIFLPNPSTDSFLGLQFSGSTLGSAGIAPLPASPFYAGSGTLALAFLFRPVFDPP